MAYSTSRNYAKEIEDAIASGASADYVAQLQAERNEKIAANQAHYDAKGIGSSDSYGQAATNYVSNANQYAGTNYHQDAIDAAIAGNWDAVTQYLGQREEKVAAQGGNNRGKTSAQIYAELWDLYGNQEPEMPTYTSGKWDTTLDQLATEILGMSYDEWVKGDEYKALMERYGHGGRMAMQDTLGQISGRTGGLASSYATTAANQQYNDYMATLEQAAREMYNGERDDSFENAQLVSGLADRDYNRYLDSLNNYWTEKNFDNSNYWNEKNFDNSNYWNQLEFDTNQDRYDQAQLQEKAETLAAYGDFSGYKALGYTDEQIALMKAAYESALAAKAAKKSPGGGDDDDDPVYATPVYTHQTGVKLDQFTGDGSSPSSKTSLNFDEDEGVFTWNGQNFTDIDKLLASIEAANLTDAEMEKLKSKFAIFGFNLE